MSASTFYRRIRQASVSRRDTLLQRISQNAHIRLHWVDNYAKFYASASMFTDKELMQSLRWTAHGVKVLRSDVDLSWKRVGAGAVVPALPLLEDLLNPDDHDALLSDLLQLSQRSFLDSLVVRYDVRRVPLKIVDGKDEDLQQHLSESHDGLQDFHPIDIYTDDIGSTRGLVKVVKRLQDLEGFGSSEHALSGQYSFLTVDVTIYWQIIRMLYCYPGLAGVRNDLFLCFGLWHAYHYAHITVWDTFRSTFLAPAFFAVFPDAKLMSRPKLTQSSTFFTWLRLAYPSFRQTLSDAVRAAKETFMEWSLQHTLDVKAGRVSEVKNNPHLARYIHLCNLQSLFEFVLPAVQDYGLALKSNDWSSFHACYLRLLGVFLCASSKGASDYQRSMYSFALLLRYWIKNDMPIMQLLRANHTVFSEESGEVALSVLSNAQPPSTKSTFESTRHYWQMVRMRYEALRRGDDLPRFKKHRLISKCFSLFFWIDEEGQK